MRYVYSFTEGDKSQAALLGGKGANLAEMTRLGLPVPPGFTISTDACRAYLDGGEIPASVEIEVTEALAEVEKQLGRSFGDAHNPLLVSVRSGAKVSMPGMMETVLNVGLNDETVHGLAEQAGGDEAARRFAADSYRRLIQMFGATVLDIPAENFEHALDELKQQCGAGRDVDLTPEQLHELIDTYKKIVRDATGEAFPQAVHEQLRAASAAVFESWNTERAAVYRRAERIDHTLGTAVNVCAMVFGNLDDNSGTGVAFTRDPSTGEPGEYGDYLVNAQGEDVVAGIRNTVPLAELETLQPEAHRELMEAMERLEGHYHDLCDIEFTVERGKLWLLQTRVGKRTAAAAFRIATHLVDEKVITLDEALQRVNGKQLANLMFPQFDDEAASSAVVLAKGLAASPGAAVGKAVFDAETALRWVEQGENVILVRRETSPDDLGGMLAAEGILTSRGGKTSHAAVVARGMGKTCVCGAEQLDVDVSAQRFTAPNGEVIREGDVISLDGSTGTVYKGDVPVGASEVASYFENGLGKNPSETLRAVARMMEHADKARRMRVRTNADTTEDAARARAFGAEGIGLCRTEHMFLGERQKHVERLILADSDAERAAALEPLRELQRRDFTGILRAMDSLPVTVRLIDPPLHEFLPDMAELKVRVALADERGESAEADRTRLVAVERMHEQNPMLGLRGVRLGLVVPELFALQVRAIAEAVRDLRAEGLNPKPEIMVPLVAAVQEFEAVRGEVERVLREVLAEDVAAEIPIGTMIELPRAALTAHEIAASAEFFSFGTNDLTQTTWGFSRDDVEAAFFSTYMERGIFSVSPFETIDVDGVGALVETGVQRGRSVSPELKIGICGEHGGDPESVHFFEGAGLDYVSCSPFRVPIARLEAARASAQ